MRAALFLSAIAAGEVQLGFARVRFGAMFLPEW